MWIIFFVSRCLECFPFLKVHTVFEKNQNHYSCISLHFLRDYQPNQTLRDTVQLTLTAYSFDLVSLCSPPGYYFTGSIKSWTYQSIRKYFGIISCSFTWAQLEIISMVIKAARSCLLQMTGKDFESWAENLGLNQDKELWFTMDFGTDDPKLTSSSYQRFQRKWARFHIWLSN